MLVLSIIIGLIAMLSATVAAYAVHYNKNKAIRKRVSKIKKNAAKLQVLNNVIALSTSNFFFFWLSFRIT